MMLVLQTNCNDQTLVWIVRRGKILGSLKQTVEPPQRPIPLVTIDRLLRKLKKKVTSIQRVVVVRGPGRFSAVRSGIVIANALAGEQHIPVHGVVKKAPFSDAEVITLSQRYADAVGGRSPVKPWYGKRPNITVPKKRR